MITHLDTLHVRGESEDLYYPHPPNTVSDVPTHSTFGISIVSKIDLVDLEVDLEDSGDSSSKLMVSFQKMVLRYVLLLFGFGPN